MSLIRWFYSIASIVLVFWILFIGKKLLIPLVLAIFIWYLINVLAASMGKIPLGKKRSPPWVNYLLAIISIFAMMGILAQLITDNISDIIRVAPEYQKHLARVMENLFQTVGYEPPSWRQLLESIQVGTILSKFATTLTGIIGNSGLIFIYLIFLFLEQKSFRFKIKAIIGDENQQKDVFNIIERVSTDIRTYIGIKTFTSALTGVLSYFLMAAVDLDFAAFWAIMIFVFNFIPTIGSIVATVFPSLLALVQFPSLTPFFVIAIGLMSFQLAIGNFLDPRLMGKSLNLSPLVIILSLLLWGSIWGIPGMILCVPISAIGMIVLSHFEKTRPIAILMSKDGKIKPKVALPTAI